LQLALEKVLQLQDGWLSADEKREVAVLRLQVALARWNAEKARVHVGALTWAVVVLHVAKAFFATYPKKP
jgi:hypothetical protein